MKKAFSAKQKFFIPLLLILSVLMSRMIECRHSGQDGDAVFWDEVNSPQRIGRLACENLLSRPHYMMYRTTFYTGIHYAEACAGLGAGRMAGVLQDNQMLARLSDRYARVYRDSLIRSAAHVDAHVYGILPLEMYLQTREDKWLQEGIALAEMQWANPDTSGITAQARYWVDDLWMITSLQVQAFRATGERRYLDRAARMMDAYLRRLQQPNGLFHHGEQAPYFWGRGNGWAAAGLAELLSVLPGEHANYGRILQGYRKMMDALRNWQAEDGMWRQLIDHEASWPETSATAMFGYAIATGVKRGLLPAKAYAPVYQKAWLALSEYVDENGSVGEVCAGTGKSAEIAYYLNRPRSRGDLHGQAPLLWFAAILLQ